jgi:hypothetical protein
MNQSMRNSKFRTPWFLSCLALLVFGTLFLQSCKKEYFELDRVKDATWNPEVAVPLIKSNITVPEILGRFDDDEIITIDPATGLLALKYSDEIFALAGQDFLVFPGQSAPAAIPVTAADVADVTTNGSTTQSVTVPVTLSFSSNEEISRVIFNSGDLTLNFNQQTSYNTSLSIRIPDLTLNGTPYTISGINPATTNSVTEPLAGYILNMGGTNPNEFTLDVTYTYSGVGGTPGVGVNVDVVMSGPNSLGGPGYSRLEGDFGQQGTNLAGRVGLRLFENDLGGTILWDSAIVRGYFTNTFGVPIDINFSRFRAINTETQDSLNILGLSSINIPAAVSASVPGRDSFNLVGNTGGANINDVANLNPDEIAYRATVVCNGSNNSFATDTSSVVLDLEAVLPFDGRALDFSRGSVAQVDIFPLDGDVEEIVSVTIHITIDNGFPADAFAQVYFCDSSFVDSLPFAQQTASILDSAFASGRSTVFASPTPDQFGNVNQNEKARSVLDIVLTRDQLERLEAGNMTKIAMQGWLETFNMGNTRVKIFNNYSMDFYLGMKVEAKIKVAL